jgi:RNA polymerase sigma factor (sigma-70 family)
MYKVCGFVRILSQNTRLWFLINECDERRQEMEVVRKLIDDPGNALIPPTNESGNESFQVLFRTYYPIVLRQMMRIVRNQSIAEDLTQEVFLNLYKQDRTQIHNVAAWLSKASIYAAYNYLRSEKRRTERDAYVSSDSLQIEPSSEETWLQQYTIEAVRDILTEMDERDRALLMRYSGFGYQELAEALSIQPTSVGTLLGRARKKFADMYRKKGRKES